MGFGVPIGAWLRGPLRDWGEALLTPSRLRAEGYFDELAVGRRWREHLEGRKDHTPELWSILMFQAWLDAERSRSLSVSGEEGRASQPPKRGHAPCS